MEADVPGGTSPRPTPDGHCSPSPDPVEDRRALPRLLASDLDGTLSERGAPLGPADLEVLDALGRAGIVRVIATGRSLWSARRVLPLDTPIDYLVFSSGAGVVRWSDQSLVEAFRLGEAALARARTVLEREGLSHMVHAPPPDTHRFAWIRLPGTPRDFDERVARYARWCEPRAPGEALPAGGAAHLVAISDPGRLDCLGRLREALPDLEVVRTTSPLDGRSLWIEIFPAHVSKAQAVGRIAARHGIDAGSCVGVGNDWNDLSLLRWSGRAYVLAGAPPPLRRRYAVLDRPPGEALAALPFRGELPRPGGRARASRRGAAPGEPPRGVPGG